MSYVQARLALNWGAAFGNDSRVTSFNEVPHSAQLTWDEFLERI